MLGAGIRLVAVDGCDSLRVREALRAAGYLLHEERVASPDERAWVVIEPRDEAPSIEQRLSAMRAAYHGSLGDRLRELGVELAAWSSGREDARERARALAHRIRGTAGSYGYARIGEAVGALEDALSALPCDASAASLALDRALEEHAGGAPSTDSDVLLAGASVRSRLLVIASDPAVAARARTLAARSGVDVTIARDGRQACDAVLESDASFVGALIDVQLGAGDGFRAAHDLRSLEAASAMPIAFVSAQGDLAHRVQAVHAGAVMSLRSPLDEGELDGLVALFESLRKSAPPTLLLVDDDPEVARLVEAFLTPVGIRVRHLSDPAELLRAIAEQPPDLVLLDVQMEPVGGLDLCRTLRAMPEMRAVPILFLTSHTGEIVRLACYDAGGDDYLAKPVTRAELLARVRARLERARFFRERSEIDALTTLTTRRAASSAAVAMLASAERTGDEVSLVMIDLDHFKDINDAHGHAVGDEVLNRIGRLLNSRLRPGDLRARWGGEEILLVLSATGRHTASQVVERLLAEVRDLTTSLAVTFSAGIAVAPHDGRDLGALLRAADRRLYRAKAEGRARVIASSPEAAP